MANFDAQIQALAGTIPVTANALQWFNDGMKDVVNRYMIINPKMLSMLSAEQTPIVNSGGSNVVDSTLIVSVRRGEKIATEISPFDRFDAKSTTSLKRATNDHPKYYVLNGVLYVLPNPENTSGNKGYVDVVTYTDVTNLASSTISDFPKEWYRLPVLYASIKVLHERMVSYSAQLPSDIVLPVVPVMSSFPVAPVDPEIPVFIANTVSMPSAPTYSSVSYVAPVMESLDFVKLKFYIETEEDPELAASQVQKINAKVQKFQTESNASLQEYQSNMQNQLNEFNEANSKYQAEMQKAVQDAQSSNQKEVQEYSSKIQRHGQAIANYQAKVGKAIQEYSSQLQTYQAEMGAIVQKFNSEMQKTNMEYQWMQGQMAYLMQEYEKGFVPIQPPQPPREES
jgi:hypothetical protein